jgi:hypothetical protein
MGNFFAAIGTAIYNFITNPVVQAVLFVAQGVTAHQAAMKAKRTGADILLQKYGTGGGIPVIYGTRRVAGTVVYMETQNNRELYVVYAIAAHELDSFDLESIQLDGRTVKDTNIYRQGYDISDGTTRIQFRPSGGTTTRASGTFWGNTSTERANITGGANINNKARMTFNCHKGTTTQAADPMLEGILTDWTSNHKLTGIAYIAANYEYDTQGMFSGIPNLTIVVNGKKVFDPRDTGQTFGTESTYTHSSNAALCLLDYITNDDYGKGLGTSDLESDFASWKTAADDCDTSVDTINHDSISVESASTDSDVMIIADASQAKFNKLKIGSKYTVDDGTTTYVNNKKLIDKDSTQIDIDGSNAFAILKLKFEDGAIDNAITSATSCDFAETQIRFDCNGVLDTEETVLENTKLLIANMRGIFTYANGKYQIKVEGAESSVVTLDEDDILESGITLSLENKEAKYNKVEAEFYNAQKRYESDTTYYTGETSDTFLADDGNEVLETRIQLPFCTNQRIAYNHAKGLLKRSRKQKTISFVATPKILKAKVGEVITVSNSNLNLSSELYRITNMTINPDLNVAVTAIEYQTDVYGYVTPPDEDIDIPDDPPEGNRVVAPTNLTFTNKNATTGEAAKLTWTDSTKYPSYEFRVRIIDGLKTRYDKRVKDTYFYLDGISVANGYEAKVSAINSLGVESDSTDITVNVTTEPVTTPDIKDGSITADKILANTITANEIAAGTITATELDADSVTADKIDVTNLSAITSNLGAIDAGSLNINSGQFVVTSAGAMTAQSATITGSVTSSSGTIGGFTLGNNFLTAGSATSRIKLSTADGIHMGNDTFALAPFNVTKSGQVTATDLILKKGNVTYFDSTDGFSAEAIAQIASSLNTRVQTFAFSSENNTDYATIETTEDSQDIKLVVRANASSLQGSGTSEALAIAEIPDNLTIKIEFDDNTGFTSPTTIGSLQTYNASTDGTPLASEYEIETLDLSELGGDFSAFVLGNDGAVNASGDIVYTVSSYTVATAGTYYFRVIYDTTDTTYNATNDPDSFTRSLEIEDLSGSGFLISNGSSGAQTSDAVTLTGTQTITGAKTFSATTTFSGDVNISGDLSVTGTTTTIDTATLNVEDKNITLNYATGDSSSTADGAGITIQDAVNSTTDATILWNATNDEFDFSHPINITGAITSSGTSTFDATDIAQIEIGDGGASASTDARNIGSKSSFLLIQRDGLVPIEIWGSRIESRSTHYFGGSSSDAEANIDTSGNFTTSGTVSATSFSGDGSGLTGITSTTINNNADNRIITGSNTANTLNGEANMTWDGATLDFGSTGATISGVGILTAGYQKTSGDIFIVNGTGIMDVSRNLSSIGTISSGAITSSTSSVQNLDLTLSNTTSGTNNRVRILTTASSQTWALENDQNLNVFKIRNTTSDVDVLKLNNNAPDSALSIDSSGATFAGTLAVGGTSTNSSYGIWLQNNKWYATQYSSSHDVVRFNANTDGGLDIYNQTDGGFANTRVGSLNIGSTTVIDSSFNLTNIGTISSGAITTSGLLTVGSGAGAIKINESYVKARSSDNANDINLIANINVFDADDVVIGSTTGERYNDNIVFRTNGSQALRLDSSQNATFAENVYIGSADTTGGLLTIHGNGTGNNEGGEIRLATASDHDGTYDFYRIDVNADDLRFGRQGETDLTIKNTGSVEIGQHIDGLVFPNSHSEDKIRLYKGGSEKIGTASGVLVLTGNSINFKKVGGAPDLQHNGTVFLNSSLELTNIANISSGAITASAGSSGATLPSNRVITLEDDANAVMAIAVPTTSEGGLFFPRDTVAYYAGIARNNTNLLLKNNNATVLTLDSSLNATFAGTISSGAITTTGNATIQKNIPMLRFISADGSSNSYSISGNINNTVDGGFFIQEGTTNGTNVRLSIDASGDVGIGKINAAQKLDVGGNIGIGGTEVIDSSRNFFPASLTSSGIVSVPSGIQFRFSGPTDPNHYVQKVGTGFSGVTIDGPQLNGYQGGELTTNYTGNNWALRWNISGDVFIRGDLDTLDISTEHNTTKNTLTRDWVTLGSGSRANGLIINDIAGANYAITGGGYDLTFYKDVSGTSWSEVMKFNATNASDSTVDVSIANNLSVGGAISSSGAGIAFRLTDTNITDSSHNTLVAYASAQNKFSIGVSSTTGLSNDITINGVNSGVTFTGAISVGGTISSSNIINGLAYQISGTQVISSARNIEGVNTITAGNTIFQTSLENCGQMRTRRNEDGVPLATGLAYFAYNHNTSTHPTSASTFDDMERNNITSFREAGVYTNASAFSLSADAYLTEFHGYLYVSTAGTYQFGVNADDAVDLYIDGQRVADDYGGHGATGFLNDNSASIYLNVGYHKFFGRFEEVGGGDSVHFGWNGGSGSTITAIPTGNLFHCATDAIKRQSSFTRMVGDLSATGEIIAGGNVTAYSDERLKDNIETLDGSKVYAMRGVSFTKDNKAGSGVIAQELEKIAPELVHTAEDGMETKSVAYGNLVGYLIEAVKELKAEIEELKKA